MSTNPANEKCERCKELIKDCTCPKGPTINIKDGSSTRKTKKNRILPNKKSHDSHLGMAGSH